MPVGPGVGVIGFFLFAPLFQWLCMSLVSEEERHFRAIYALMTKAQRQSLIDHHMRRLRCTRKQAMRYAVEDWEGDKRRW